MIGSPRVHHRQTDSTNARARELASAGARHGTLVTAGEQTAGRGRQGRSWETPPGRALLMSLVLRHLGAARELLPLAAAVAVCEACEAVAPVRCRVKWPNDVWIDERKVAGILIEGRPAEGWAVLGIGLNVNTDRPEFPPELRAAATSLRLSAPGTDPALEDVLSAVVGALEARLGDQPSGVLDRWRQRDALIGQPVRWADGAGVGAGIDDTGALLVDVGGRRVSLDAGEVHLGPAT